MYYTFAKILIAFGALLILIGMLILVSGKIGFLGRVPGDIHIEKKNLEFHSPIVTCIFASILLSLLVSAFFLWLKK